MAEQKRWAVRTQWYSGLYFLFLGPKPCSPKDGRWSTSDRNCWRAFGADEFEAFFPDCYHLPPGGGPVAMRFEEATA